MTTATMTVAETSTRKPRKAKKARELERRGKEAAIQYLMRRGYDVLERDWTCIAGTVDLIVSDGDCLVFVEVKTRSNANEGFLDEKVTAEKREKLERIAAMFLQNHRISDVTVRFDVVSIISYGADRAFVKHWINALA